MSLDDRLIVEPAIESHERSKSIKVKKWIGTWPAKCDICGVDLTPPCLYFVDGRTKQGPWALMCTQCHYSYGVGLGTGYGQKYDSKTLEKLEG